MPDQFVTHIGTVHGQDGMTVHVGTDYGRVTLAAGQPSLTPNPAGGGTPLTPVQVAVLLAYLGQARAKALADLALMGEGEDR